LTLVELLITIAVITILAGVAWPLYKDQSFKNRRAGVISDMGKIKVFLQRCYTDDGGYSCCDDATMNTYRTANPPPLPPVRSYTYTFTPTNPDANMSGCKVHQGYTVTATPTGAQQGDNDCVSFTINHLGDRTAQDNTAAANPRCWAN
jgi:type IV pilus assembly protein PilE